MCASFSCLSQSTDVKVTGEEYIPVEGSGKTPAALQGEWVLSSGIKASNKKHSREYYKSKPAPGTKLNSQTKTSTEVKNGVTITRTEETYDRVAEPGKQVTPAQKSNLHKPGKPTISFFGLNQTFSGFSGCNKFAGRYSVSGNTINFIAENPSTQMVCIGDYDEADFLQKLKRVNGYKASSDRLQLLSGSNVLLTFKRK
jgi:heat shock protein HslJ